MMSSISGASVRNSLNHCFESSSMSARLFRSFFPPGMSTENSFSGSPRICRTASTLSTTPCWMSFIIRISPSMFTLLDRGVWIARERYVCG